MKSILFNYLKPQYYYQKLFYIFFILSIISSLSLIGFKNFQFDLFLVKFIIIFFLFMTIAVFVEFLDASQYISPIELYQLEFFFNSFLKEIREIKKFDEFDFENYFHKYDSKSKKIVKNFFKRFKKRFYISSIKKVNSNTYRIVFIDEFVLFRYFFIRFFAKSGLHRAIVKKNLTGFKIIFIE